MDIRQLFPLQKDVSSSNTMGELILNTVSEGVVGIDLNGVITFANPAAAQMTGWSVEQMVGELAYDMLCHARVHGSSTHLNISPRFNSNDVEREQMMFWRKDRTQFLAEYTLSQVLEQRQPVGRVMVFRDISRHARTEEALQKIHMENRLILQAAGEGIYGVDCQGLITFVNPAAARMLGYAVDELIGQPMQSLMTKPDELLVDETSGLCPIHAAFQNGEVHQVEDQLFVRKNASKLPVKYTSTPIIEDEKICGAVVVFNDITQRKQAEEELKQAYAKVECMKRKLQAENDYLQEEFRIEHDFKEIVGQSHAIEQILRQIELVAPTLASVLVTGESGTGKELIARAIHDRSERRDRPLIRVNCAAIPHELFESEFFGHIRGSFTGAVNDRTGRFELADGGTIFLDEVGEIPLKLQSKLLRVIQEGQFERIGENLTRTVDVRIIAATNNNLKQEVAAGRFRQDLYFRLNVYPIEAVPLRERLEDIPLLVQHFVKQISQRLKRVEPRITQADIQKLMAYPWNGNVRELQNAIERALIISQGDQLRFDLMDKYTSRSLPANLQPLRTHNPGQHIDSDKPFSEHERIERDRSNILAALRVSNGKVSGEGGAAELLGIRPTTLASRMKAMNINKSELV